MMSVLIQGMEMPKDGAYWCEISVADDIATITIHGEDRKSFHLVPTADVQPVVRCKDCKYWRDRYVKCNDGAERKYTEEELHCSDGIMIGCVCNSVGINMGAMCRYEDNRGWRCDKSVFRGPDDYCSKGEKRPCAYDTWWGIVNGKYPPQPDQ